MSFSASAHNGGGVPTWVEVLLKKELSKWGDSDGASSSPSRTLRLTLFHLIICYSSEVEKMQSLRENNVYHKSAKKKK